MTTVTHIHYGRGSRTLDLTFDDGLTGTLSAEFLRVYSPSAEVRGHGGEAATLQTGKREVAITDIKPVGHYAIQLIFDDGHDSGLYSWKYLHELCCRRDQLWLEYLSRLQAAGATRDPDTQVIHFTP